MNPHRHDQPDDAPAPQAEASTPAADFPAVAIPHGPIDTTLGTPAEASDEQLKLPRGALVIMRQSGGLRFRTTATVVFRDGRLAVAGGTHTRPLVVRRLSDDELVALRQMLDDVVAANLPASIGHQNPDFYAYELAMRPGRLVQNFEVFAGSMPEAVEPLVRWLNAAGGPPPGESAQPVGE